MKAILVQYIRLQCNVFYTTENIVEANESLMARR